MSRGRTKQCLLWSRDKEVQEWNEQKMLVALGGKQRGNSRMKLLKSRCGHHEEGQGA